MAVLILLALTIWLGYQGLQPGDHTGEILGCLVTGLITLITACVKYEFLRWIVYLILWISAIVWLFRGMAHCCCGSLFLWWILWRAFEDEDKEK